jgi:hypothetical protein
MSIRCPIEHHIAAVVMHRRLVNSVTVGDTWAIRDKFTDQGFKPPFPYHRQLLF